jgi:hypothetical protein
MELLLLALVAICLRTCLPLCHRLQKAILTGVGKNCLGMWPEGGAFLVATHLRFIYLHAHQSLAL